MFYNHLILKVPLKYKNSYSYKITKDHETSIAGIPQIYNGVVSLPEYFIKYIWEFYCPNYHKAILTCVILHEMAHAESGILDTPPYEHHRCDIYAVNLMYNREQGLYYLPYDRNHFYSSLIVISQYWSARKGAGGHLFNIGWNALNFYAIAMGGSGTVGDLFATDISNRLSLFKSGNPSANFIFKRSLNNLSTKEGKQVKPLFVGKKIRNYAIEQDAKLNRWLACESIKKGMVESQVIKILGKPEDVTSGSVSEIPGPNSIQKDTVTIYTVIYNYKDGNKIGITGTQYLFHKKMKHQDLLLGLASLCVGGGQGAAVIVERQKI